MRTWRLADVLAIALLVFNLGVTLTRVNMLERAQEAAETRIEALRVQVQDLRERLVRQEARP